MLVLIARRLIFGAATLWLLSVFIFAATEVLPGDVASAILGRSATEALKKQIRSQLGLDRPAVVRYVEWLGGTVSGDLGTSLASGRPVVELIGDRIVPTLVLAGVAMAVALPLGLGAGIFSASFPGSRFEKAISLVGLVAVALPEYFVGALVVIVFALELRLLPAISYSPDFSTLSGFVRALTLPVLTMTAAIFAHMSRLTRAAMTDVLRSSYIEMAILKGVSRRRLVFLHTLPNALGPIANVVALSVGYMFGGVILVEVVFAYPGLARLMVDAVSARDIPLVQATTLLFAGSYIVINVVADLVAVLANPRLRS